jgi:CO/xanthine dehydrogenase Mo-binding subunit
MDSFHDRPLSRRDLLKAGGALVVAIGFATSLPKRALAQTLAGAESDIGKPLALDEVDSFLAIHGDGSVTVFAGKVDLGTGFRVAVRQMVAEELDIPMARIALVEGDTALTPDQGPTAGSTGITRGAVPIRQAAATARQALLRLAAETLGHSASDLVIEDGQVRSRAASAKVDIGKLIGDKRFSLKVDAKAPLKDPAGYKIVGKPVPRPDLPAKCTGTHIYVHDFRLPGMLHGRAIRPPAIGAKLLAVDETSIAGVPAVRVVRIQDFLGVVAEDEWAAIRAARELKATWSEWRGLPGNRDLARAVREAPVEEDEVVASSGFATAAIPEAATRLSATYFWPVQTHGSIGPSCAVADVRADGITLWTASQATHKYRAAFAKMLDMPQEKIRLVYLDGAGCYGMNGHDDAAADAILLSKSVGRPVRVQWMREDEHGWDPKGPPQLLDLRAGLGAGGDIVEWQTEMWLPAATKGLPNIPLIAPEAAGLQQPLGHAAGHIYQNGDPPYAASNLRVVAHWLKSTPLRPSNIRAPGKVANTFAVEGFVDELAAAVKVDPLEFRLRRLSEPRGIEVLKRVAEMFAWKSRPSPDPNAMQGKLAIGRGIAYIHYKHAENFVAMAMEVAVDRALGEVRVRRVACAHDCGLVINPDAVKNQIEGAIVQTLSRTLHEEVTFDDARVTSVDWSSYPILTMPEAPQIDVDLIDRPNLPPVGAGEAAATPVPAALANAIFDATGVRFRTVPFTSERVKAALIGH